MHRFFHKIIFICCFFLFGFCVFASPKQSSQIIKSGHWIYDDLTVLAAESKNTIFLETQPLSVGEINFYLNDIDYNGLSASGKVVYERVQRYLNKDDDFIKNNSLRLFLNLKANPEFFYKSNPQIDWSFFPNFKDSLFNIPVIIGFSDLFTIQSDFEISRNSNEANKPNSFMNIPLDFGGYEFLYFQNFAYFSGTKLFNDWGISSHMGKHGMKIGNTSLGSILYNDTFESDFYYQLNLFTKSLKYSMDVTQVDNEKYLYLHQLTFKPLKNMNIGVIEGSLITSPFELRFLNPIMIMHSFTGWWDRNEELNNFYGESNFCAYLGFTFDYIPVKNLRIYGLYAQNEILDFGDPKTPENLCMPDSLGGQIGIEYNIPLKNYSHVKTVLESAYTSPYLYVKHSPRWSLIKTKRGGNDFAMKSWLGLPTGPDSFQLFASATYESNKNWNVGLSYKLSIHGENTAENLFNRENSFYYDKENDRWLYYPSVQFDQGKKENNQSKMDSAVRDARNMWMHGISEYKHEIAINGHYRLFENLDFTGQFSYTFVFNNKNKLDNFANGVELAFAVTYNLF